MNRNRPTFDDEEELYIPDIGEVDEEIGYHERPRSNAGIALGWSPFEQQLFDIINLNRFGTYEKDVLVEMANEVVQLIKSFKPHEVARIASAAMLAFQLKALENKDFEEELEKYREYIKNHPEDVEEV